MADTMQSLDQLSALKPAAAPETPKYIQKLDKQGRSYATGKRKDAVARVWVKPGAGKIVVNTRERAGRVADFIELAELLCIDALHRTESCGGHFREEYQYTDEKMKGEAKRDDEHFMHVAAWEYQGEGRQPALHKEPLVFEYVKPSQRSYK